MILPGRWKVIKDVSKGREDKNMDGKRVESSVKAED